MNENIPTTIEISENKAISVYSDYLEWGNERILYRDIDGLAYKWTATNVYIYFIPSGTANRYYIGIRHKGKITRINFPSSTFGGIYGSKSSENFLKLSSIIDEVIKPIVITNLLAKYSETEKLEIANLKITSEGIYKKTWMGDKLLSYAEYHGSFINHGNLYIFRRSKNHSKEKIFYTISTVFMNAVILPDILDHLSERGILKTKSAELDITDEQLTQRRYYTVSAFPGIFTAWYWLANKFKARKFFNNHRKNPDKKI